MAVKTIARPGHETTTEPQPAYILRGYGLFALYREDLQYIGAGKWLIPSGSTSDKLYEVRVGVRRLSCECVGFMNHNHCSHVVCAELAHKKSAVCDCCGERKYWAELFEVQEEDELLAWYPGDVLCRSCARRHWA